ERDIEGAGALVRLVPEIVERPGIIGWARHLGLPERRQRLHRHHPGRDRRCEILGEKGTERLAFPGLHIARRPIVEEAQSDDVVACRRNRNWLALRIARPDPDAELELVIEIAAWAKARHGLARRLALALRPAHRRARGADRRAAAVIGDRHVLVIG